MCINFKAQSRALRNFTWRWFIENLSISYGCASNTHDNDSSDDGKNGAGNNDTDEQQKIEDFDLIDLTNDEFDDFNFKDPGITSDTDFNASYDDGIDAQSNSNLFRCHKPTDENLQHSFANIERHERPSEFKKWFDQECKLLNGCVDDHVAYIFENYAID